MTIETELRERRKYAYPKRLTIFLDARRPRDLVYLVRNMYRNRHYAGRFTIKARSYGFKSASDMQSQIDRVAGSGWKQSVNFAPMIDASFIAMHSKRRAFVSRYNREPTPNELRGASLPSLAQIESDAVQYLDQFYSRGFKVTYWEVAISGVGEHYNTQHMNTLSEANKHDVRMDQVLMRVANRMRQTYRRIPIITSYRWGDFEKSGQYYHYDMHTGGVKPPKSGSAAFVDRSRGTPGKAASYGDVVIIDLAMQEKIISKCRARRLTVPSFGRSDANLVIR